MRLIRITLVGLALATATAPVTWAQESPSASTRRVSGKRAIAMLLKDIDLDSAQRVKVDSIMVKYRNEMQGLRKDDGSRDEAARLKMGKLLEEQQRDTRAIMTRKQQAVFDKNAARLRERTKARDAGVTSRGPNESRRR